MKNLRRSGHWVKRLLGLVAMLALLAAPAMALAGRSGGSFGGRTGFRSGGGFSMPRSSSGYSSPYRYGGGGSSHFFFFPSFGGYGYGGYGFGGLGSLVLLAAVGITIYSVVRAARRYRQASSPGTSWGWGDGDDAPDVLPDRGYVYRTQVALGRSARGIQDRLARFASEGDTATTAGLATLLQQTALELLREKDSIRYGGADVSGPMSLTNAETKMNGWALGERSRFQVERVRSAEGTVRRADAAAEEGREALELVVITVVVATRAPLPGLKPFTDRAGLDAVLAQLGEVAPDKLLGLEVIWTPADPNDSMTETDVMVTYPDLRSL